MNTRITNNQSLATIEANITQELEGKQLWGDLSLSLEEYKSLRGRIKFVLKQSDDSISSICKLFPNSITTFLVFLVRYRYNLNFWRLVGEELAIPIAPADESLIGKCAISSFKRHHFDFSEAEKSTRIYVEPILYESGIPPESSLADLFYVLNYDRHTIFDPQLVIDDLIEMRSFQIRKSMLRFLKRFRDDRALEFMLEVHDAMLCVDQGMGSDSSYIEHYRLWKETERSKEAISKRKQQESQTKPYLSFESGRQGLCMVLPRTILQDEWIEEAEWIITDNTGFTLHKRMTVFGEEGRRYIESIITPIAPAESYTVDLIDVEGIANKILSWGITGIEKGKALFFNANGRSFSANYLPYPYVSMVFGSDVIIGDLQNVTLTCQSYPLQKEPYKIITVEANNRNAYFSFFENGSLIAIRPRPQVNMLFSGKALFGLEESTKQNLFTDIPLLTIEIDEGALLQGLQIHIGKNILPIDDLFAGNRAIISLRSHFPGCFDQYGTYGVRLYQYDHFLKQCEFRFVPKINSNYSPILLWPTSVAKEKASALWFEKNTDWQLEFSGGTVNVDENGYSVSCPPGMGALSVTLNDVSDKRAFSATFDLPIRPFELSFFDINGALEEENLKIRHFSLSELLNAELWLNLKCFGLYVQKNYRIVLKSENGIEQEEPLRISQDGCGNINLSIFNDTLKSCPLPATFTLCCVENEAEQLAIGSITDTVQFSRPPKYTNGHYLALLLDDAGYDLTIRRFGANKFEQHLSYKDSRLNKTKDKRGYPCGKPLPAGLYTVESSKKQHGYFEFEDEIDTVLANGTNTFYVSPNANDSGISSFSDWLDKLIRVVLDIKTDASMSGIRDKLLEQLKGIPTEALTELDFERLIALAYFYSSKCTNSKREFIHNCMRQISLNILTAEYRLEILRHLLLFQCSEAIFTTCLREYHLYLFLPGSDDARILSSDIERFSAELGMLLRMGADDAIRNTLWREKYRDIIGREAIRSLLSVPGTNDPSKITEEQRRFLREEAGNKVHILLTKDISGDMDPISQMTDYDRLLFDKTKKPDIGVYFDHIRYVDQYVNWYSLNASKDLEIKPETRSKMISVTKQYARSIMLCFQQLMTVPEIKKILGPYENALSARDGDDPLRSLNSCIPSRFLYLQGIAAFLAKLPRKYQKYSVAIRTGERFIIHAVDIAPRIARRDLIMASTYIYLVRKENALCQ